MSPDADLDQAEANVLRRSTQAADAFATPSSPDPLTATPRPWWVRFSMHGDLSIVSDPERPNFTTIATVATGSDDYGKANAFLIVEAVNAYPSALPSAPDHRLQEALEQITGEIEDQAAQAMRPRQGVLKRWARHLRAVLSEATTGSDPALDVAYRERNALVAALIRLGGFPAEVVMAPDTEGWWIVYIETPAGQLSWHISPDDMDLFSDWPVAFGSHKSPWDGHTTDEKYARLARLSASQTPEPDIK